MIRFFLLPSWNFFVRSTLISTFNYESSYFSFKTTYSLENLLNHKVLNPRTSGFFPLHLRSSYNQSYQGTTKRKLGRKSTISGNWIDINFVLHTGLYWILFEPGHTNFMFLGYFDIRYSLIFIRQNYNFDMLATTWHEIVCWFL